MVHIIISLKRAWDRECNFDNLLGQGQKKIHARYPFLGGGTYQPPVLSVFYLQVGY